MAKEKAEKPVEKAGEKAEKKEKAKPRPAEAGASTGIKHDLPKASSAEGRTFASLNKAALVKPKDSGAIKEIAAEIEKESEKKEELAKEDLALEVERESPKLKKSKKKKAKEKPTLIEYAPKEIEELVVNLSNQGHSASEIGVILRDQHGILDVKQATKKTILQILTESGIKQEVPEDLLYLTKKAVALNEHLKKNKKDASAKRGYEMTVSKIRRLVKYYIKSKRLPADWRYSIETATLLVK